MRGPGTPLEQAKAGFAALDVSDQALKEVLCL